MVTAILNQNNAIENYILELNLPYSSALKNHMVNLISVITVTEVSKNLSSIYPSLLVIGIEVQVQGFWTHTNVIMSMSPMYLIFHAISEISNTSKDDDIGFLIIDDTLSKEDISTKNIEGLGFH